MFCTLTHHGQRRVTMDKLCPCLAHLLNPEGHGSGEIESVSLVGSVSPPPERDFAESASSWLSSIKTQAATAVLGAPDELEPHWRLLCAGAAMRLDGPTGAHAKASAALRDELVTLTLAPHHGQSASLVAPELGSRASSARVWRRWAARHSQRRGQATGSQPLPQVLELANSRPFHCR